MNKNTNRAISFCADIHDQRFMVRERDTKYPQFDVLSGNLNSDVGQGKYSIDYDAEDDILSGVKHAYVRVNVYGDQDDRRFKVEYVGFDGKTFFEEIIHEDMLTSQNDDALCLALDMNNRLVDSSAYAHNIRGRNYTFSTTKKDKANGALVFSEKTSVEIPFSNVLSFHDKSYTLSFRINPERFSAGGSSVLSNARDGQGVSFGISGKGNLTYRDHATGKTIESKYRIRPGTWSVMCDMEYNNVRR
ncbi:hypothetical protein ED312_11605 [Sinomicrobium pectinilyticum]|uniref:Uncharacterized protein n=1 Tax=Sinomicrobium pectinilyticum TaxID=1084421 RepID=A0A3N0EEH3_SINP1|nr:hypothetical protein [Sinomicrobium pectinilyticum]RNL86278.1 hypothetical protein ED312_11605 [Sinomicrobium pectinilyticum]